MSEEAEGVELSLTVQADDQAVVRLNGRMVRGPGGAFNGEALAISITGEPGEELLAVGENCLDVEVHDTGRVFVGFTLAGSVTAAGGACTLP